MLPIGIFFSKWRKYFKLQHPPIIDSFFNRWPVARFKCWIYFYDRKFWVGLKDSKHKQSKIHFSQHTFEMWYIFMQASRQKILLMITWTAVRAATMAGEPKPWVIIEKWVKWRWMLGSRICCGLVLQRGLRSWFNKSINSLTITL